MNPELINYIWGACGFGMGVLFATICLTISAISDAKHHDKLQKEERERLREQYERKLIRRRDIQKSSIKKFRYIITHK